MPRRFILDTHIYDEIVAAPAMPEQLARLQEAREIIILQTHIERDELTMIPDEQKRAATLAIQVTTIPTSGGVLDLSKWGEFTWGEGSGDVKIGDVRSESGNHNRDALIAATASAEADVLVTHDNRLTNCVHEVSALPVWTFAQFREFIESLES